MIMKAKVKSFQNGLFWVFLLVMSFEPLLVTGQNASDLLINEYRELRHATCQVIINNTSTCTGAILNHHAQKDGLFIITAAHCIPNIDAINTAFFVLGDFPLLYENTHYTASRWVSNGAFELLAYNEELDFALFYLDELPPRHLVPYQLGWDPKAQNPAYGISFHYGQFDYQKTALGRNVIEPGSFIGYPDVKNGFWKVSDWSVGATDIGSSGAGLIDHRFRFLGGLSGSTLSQRDTIDYFFRFDYAYDYFSDSDMQLAHWIDPQSEQRVKGENQGIFSKLNLYNEYDAYAEDYVVSGGQSYVQEVQLTGGATVVGIYLIFSRIEELVPFSELSIELVSDTEEVLYTQNIFLEDLESFRENYIELFSGVDLPPVFQIQLSLPEGQAGQLSLPLLASERSLIALLVEGEAALDRSEEEDEAKVRVFPNPTSSFSYIPDDGIESLSFYNAEGMKVEPSYVHVNNEYIIDWTGLHSGLYFINIQLINHKKSYFRVVVRN